MEYAEPNATPPKPPPRKRWFRFSISTLLLVSVIVALGVSHWTTARDRLAMEREFDEIREDYDWIQIYDRNIVHVLPQAPLFHRMGEARVFLPEGEAYVLKFDWLNQIQDESSRQVYPGRELPPGHYRINYAIQYEPSANSGDWHVCLSAVSRSREVKIQYPLPNDVPLWLEAERIGDNRYQMPTNEDGTPGMQVQFATPTPWGLGHAVGVNPGEKAFVIRYAAVEANKLVKFDDLPFEDDVFRIWIERAPQKP